MKTITHKTRIHSSRISTACFSGHLGVYVYLGGDILPRQTHPAQLHAGIHTPDPLRAPLHPTPPVDRRTKENLTDTAEEITIAKNLTLIGFENRKPV